MSGGGDGNNWQPQDNSLQLEQMRMAAADRERQREEAEKKQKEEQFNTDLSSATAAARNTGKNFASGRGLNPDDFMSVIDSIVNDAKLRVPRLDPAVGQYFTSDIFSTGFQNEENARRARFNSQVNNTFAPGFESNMIGDTSDDAIIEAILGEQRGTAEQQLDFSRKRGLLNDAGYNVAQQKFGGQEQAARSTLGDIGDAVLGTLRGGLSGIRGEAGSAASGYSLGSPEFKVDPYLSKATKYKDESLTGLEGKLRSAVGSTELFDIPSILAAAGTAQGPRNLSQNAPVSGVPFNERRSNKNRGLGSTGEF